MNILGIWRWIGDRSLWEIVLIGLLFALTIEVVTCFMRFGLGLQSTRDTSWLAPLTAGYRIHHGYIGVLLLLITLVTSSPSWHNLLIAVGVGLVVSDAVHHFLVLWPITGDPEFHIRYPGWRR